MARLSTILASFGLVAVVVGGGVAVKVALNYTPDHMPTHAPGNKYTQTMDQQKYKPDIKNLVKQAAVEKKQAAKQQSIKSEATKAAKQLSEPAKEKKVTASASPSSLDVDKTIEELQSPIDPLKGVPQKFTKQFSDAELQKLSGDLLNKAMSGFAFSYRTDIYDVVCEVADMVGVQRNDALSIAVFESMLGYLMTDSPGAGARGLLQSTPDNFREACARFGESDLLPILKVKNKGLHDEIKPYMGLVKMQFGKKGSTFVYDYDEIQKRFPHLNGLDKKEIREKFDDELFRFADLTDRPYRERVLINTILMLKNSSALQIAENGFESTPRLIHHLGRRGAKEMLSGFGHGHKLRDWVHGIYGKKKGDLVIKHNNLDRNVFGKKDPNATVDGFLSFYEVKCRVVSTIVQQMQDKVALSWKLNRHLKATGAGISARIAGKAGKPFKIVEEEAVVRPKTGAGTTSQQCFTNG